MREMGNWNEYFIGHLAADSEAAIAVMAQNNELVTWDDGQLTPGDGALQEDILKKVPIQTYCSTLSPLQASPQEIAIRN